jgi:hypothetical protein
MRNQFSRAAASVFFGVVLIAQTPAETDSVRRSLDVIEQKTLTLRTLIESSTKPSNWQSLTVADSNAIAAAADSVTNVAASGIQLHGFRVSTTAMGGVLWPVIIDFAYKSPASGGAIRLSSSNPAVAAVVSSVTPPTGVWGVNTTIQTSPVISPTQVEITATSGASTVKIGITILPVMIRSVWLPATIAGGASARGEISLYAAAPAGGVMLTLTSSCTPGSVVSTVSFPEGAVRIPLPVQTFAVGASTPCTVTATGPYNVAASNIMTITP